MSSVPKNTAFEIRFCNDNTVQVFDLTQRRARTDRRPLPYVYKEEDVLEGHVRFSKLVWDSSSSILSAPPTPPSDDHHRGSPKAIIEQKNKRDPSQEIIPTVANRMEESNEKEERALREAEEAVRKAMERKARIAQARDASRQRKEAQAQVQVERENDAADTATAEDSAMNPPENAFSIHHDESPSWTPSPPAPIHEQHTQLTYFSTTSPINGQHLQHQPMITYPQKTTIDSHNALVEDYLKPSSLDHATPKRPSSHYSHYSHYSPYSHNSHPMPAKNTRPQSSENRKSKKSSNALCCVIS